jgi:hypothetical protein
MRIRIIIVRQLPLALLMLLTFALFEVRTTAQQRADTSLRIKAMQVKLFMMREGTFGDDLIATDQARIVWNVGVNATADRFLVIVEVLGPSIFREPLPRLLFTATQGRRVVLKQTARIFNAIGDGTYYAAFLVPTTGCDSVKLTARIPGQSPGQRKPATMTQLVNFQCGE